MSNYSPSKIQQMIRNLEGIFKTSRSEDQRKRVFRDIQMWKKELERVQAESGYEEPVYNSNHSNHNDDNSLESYELLKGIPIIQMNPNVYNKEANEVYTFIKHFEEEYLSVLSEYHLKTDFSHALLRDSFFTIIHDCYSAIRGYIDVLDKQGNESFPEDYRAKLKMTVQAEYRNMVTKVGDFFRKLYKFVDELIEDNKNDGHLLLNASSKLHFTKGTGGSKFLEGYSVLEGLQDLHLFLTELLDYLNLPDIKKKDELY